MGCWSKTCGLSNLHITAGTPVYVFVLEDARDDSNCYSTSLFSPLLLPFESEYDDYGGGENSSGPAFNMIMGSIKNHLVEMELGDNQYHDIAVTKEAFGEKLFFEAVHENRLSYKTPFSREGKKLSFTMFRKDIVDSILENRVIESYVGEGKGTFAKYGDEKNYIRYHFKDIVADVKPLLESMLLQIAEAEESVKMYMLMNGLDGVVFKNKGNLAANWLRGDSHRYSRIVNIRDMISTGLEAGTPDALARLEELLIEHLKALFIDSFMHEARKTWIPGGHEGSQSQCASAHRLLCSSIISVLDKEAAEWKAENEGYEEE